MIFTLDLIIIFLIVIFYIISLIDFYFSISSLIILFFFFFFLKNILMSVLPWKERMSSWRPIEKFAIELTTPALPTRTPPDHCQSTPPITHPHFDQIFIPRKEHLSTLHHPWLCIKSIIKSLILHMYLLFLFGFFIINDVLFGNKVSFNVSIDFWSKFGALIWTKICFNLQLNFSSILCFEFRR